MPDAKDMTQVISSFSFAHSTWTMVHPVLHKNVLMKGAQSTTLSMSGVITKCQLQKLVSIVNAVFEVGASKRDDG